MSKFTHPSLVSKRHAELEQRVIAALTADNCRWNGQFVGRRMRQGINGGYLVTDASPFAGSTIRTYRSLADVIAVYEPIIPALREAVFEYQRDAA